MNLDLYLTAIYATDKVYRCVWALSPPTCQRSVNGQPGATAIDFPEPHTWNINVVLYDPVSEHRFSAAQRQRLALR